VIRARAQVCASAVLVALATGSPAHEGATGVVKDRMDQMEDMGRAVKRINERLKGKGDLPPVAADAQSIQRSAGRIPSLFPQGSGQGHSEAKAAVWERWPEFTAAARVLEREAEKLAAVARSGSAADAQAQFGAITRACSGCHDAFRSKR
jgi:cytochrome c556